MSLIEVVDHTSDVTTVRRCLTLANQMDDRALALHYALCLWCARPGRPEAQQAVVGAALFHHDRRVVGAGFRISNLRARLSDWRAIAAADPYATWPGISELCAGGADGTSTIARLRDAGLLHSVGSYGTGAWVLNGARVTRVGRSVAVGVRGGPSDGWVWVPAFTVWDPSAALGWDSPPQETYDRLGLLATRYSYSGYWHWLMEGLVHAVRLDEAGLLLQLNHLAICLDGPESRVISESLAAAGIPPDKVLARSTPFDLEAGELVIPMRAPGFGGLIDESDSSNFREILAIGAQHSNDADIAAVRRRLGLVRARHGSRRLYVSRRDAAKRRVVNEDELLATLGRLGFEVIVPGTLTFAEQVAAFSSADMVVGPHGAGLANALFMPRGSAMLELHPADFGRPYYRRLATAVGMRYQGLSCDADPTSPRDMVVAVDEAIASVRALVGSG